MTNRIEKAELVAQWLRAMPAEDRWRSLQTRLSLKTANDASCFPRRSCATCRWRAQRLGASMLIARSQG